MLKATFNKKLPASVFYLSVNALKVDFISIMSEVNGIGQIVAVGADQAIMILIGTIANHGYDNLESVFKI